MRVSLIFPPISGFENKIPPVGIAYLAAMLEKEKIDVSVHDLNISEESLQKSINEIMRDKPSLIGISSSTPAVPKTLEIAEMIKKINKDVKIVVGGPHASVMPKELLKSKFIDFCVGGEGENVVKEMADCLKKGKKFDKIKGISFMKKGKIVSNPGMRAIENLDEIPFPAWHLFDLRRYKNFVSNEELSLPIVTSRGCPFNCTFCYKGIFGKRWRFRSPENIIQEIKYLIKEFKIKEFSVADDNFTLNPSRAIKFCKLIIENNIKIRWRCTNGIRADLASNKLFKAMKKAGCYLVAFGVETGDENILKSIEKGETLDQIRRAFKIAKEEGLETLGFFMFGNLGENEETMKKTLSLAKELNPDFAQFSIATPFPGSKMYADVKRDGKLLINSWKDYVFYEGKPIFSYKGMNPTLIGKMYRKAYRSFYFRPSYVLKSLIKAIKNPEKMQKMVLGAKQYLNIFHTKRKQ